MAGAAEGRNRFAPASVFARCADSEQEAARFHDVEGARAPLGVMRLSSERDAGSFYVCGELIDIALRFEVQPYTHALFAIPTFLAVVLAEPDAHVVRFKRRTDDCAILF